jgi:hypothetical protein
VILHPHLVRTEKPAMAIPAQPRRTPDLLVKPRNQSQTLGPANVGGVAFGAPQYGPMQIPVVRLPLHNISLNARYFRLASDSESRERFLRLRFRARAALTRIF